LLLFDREPPAVCGQSRGFSNAANSLAFSGDCARLAAVSG
jgi:hypothetical protein